MMFLHVSSQLRELLRAAYVLPIRMWLKPSAALQSSTAIGGAGWFFEQADPASELCQPSELWAVFLMGYPLVN